MEFTTEYHAGHVSTANTVTVYGTEGGEDIASITYGIMADGFVFPKRNDGGFTDAQIIYAHMLAERTFAGK